jgi:N-methylhydantoinase A
MALIVGVDIGGTFTDLMLQDEVSGEVRVAKVPSTPADPAIALLDGLRALRIEPARLALIVHGTTVATNAVLERKGARVGVIMSEGFRDVIELRRRDRPDTYGLRGQFVPLAPRERRVEVPERTDFRGRVLRAPGEEELCAAAQRLLERDAEVVVVSFLNAYANPANERQARAVLERVWPNEFVVIASDVLPEIREFERTSTAVLNGYVQPLIGRYLSSLMAALAGAGYAHDVLIVQSNGGVASQAVARRSAVNTILSGPAAGAAAAGRLGLAVGEHNLIACDVGGTSLDIAVVVEGQPATAREAALEYGLPIRVPMLDIRTVGAGGGSIAWLDRAGVLNIGPMSAGADPGPVAYGQGGTQPTVTDANLVLGRINPANAIGREAGFRLDVEAARGAIAREIGAPLRLESTEAAWAILQVANHKIAASIRMLTVEQGLDPRDFALVAYGGAGPLHAAALLRELEVARALIPPWPGITSALGCLTAEVRHDFVQSVNERLERLEPEQLYAILDAHVAAGRAEIARTGVAIERVEARFQADMAYDGQIHEVRTNLPETLADRSALRAAFEAAYRAQYGDVVGDRPVRVVTLRTAVIGVRPTPQPRPPAAPPGASLEAARKELRPVYFAQGFLETPVYERARLPAGADFHGPAVIEQGDATTVLEPGMRCRMDGAANLVLELVRP